MAGKTWVMATMTGLDELTAQFKKIGDRKVASLHMGAALRKAAKPALDALKAITPKGPTSNLRKSSTITVRNYWNQGNAASFVEHKSSRRLEKKGYHSSLMEHGTKPRFTAKRIASSFNKRGPFKINQKKVTTSGKNKGKVRFTTSPKFPKAFFKTAPKGEKVALGTGPALHLVSRAYSRALPQIQTALTKELTIALGKAIAHAGFNEGT